MNRRGFLRTLSLGGIGVSATTGAVIGNVAYDSIPDVERDGPVDENQNITIRTGTKLKQRPPELSEYYIWQDQYEEYKETKLAVGKDGNLWVKTEDNRWRRVVTV